MTNPDKPTIGDLTARLEFRYENDPLDFLKTGKGYLVVEDEVANVPLPHGPKGDKGDTGRLSEGDVRYFDRRTEEAEAAAEASEESAGRSKASKEAAETSETNAKTSEANAKTSETNAKSSEAKAAKSEANAKTSETNAKSSEAEASKSASDAHTYRQGALAYQEGSKAHREAAEAAKSGAESARDTAKDYRDGAKAHREAAKVSEDNAGTSANSANTSANAAATKASEAEAKVQQALDALTSVENIEDGLRELMDDTEAWQNVQFALEQVDSEIAAGMQQVKDDILGGVGPAFDTLLELAEAFGENRDAISAITDQLAKKSEKGHKHTSAEITDTVSFFGGDPSANRVVVTHSDGQLHSARHPVAGNHLARKSYVDDEVAKKANTSHTHTISNVSGLQTALDGKAPSKHIHSISDVDGLNAALGDASKAATWEDLLNKPSTFPASKHSHSVSEVDGLADELDTKAPSKHSHSVSEVDGLAAQLAARSAEGHKHEASDITDLSGIIESEILTSQRSFRTKLRKTSGSSSYWEPQDLPRTLKTGNRWRVALPHGTWRVEILNAAGHSVRSAVNGGSYNTKPVEDDTRERRVVSDGSDWLLFTFPQSNPADGDEVDLYIFEEDPKKAEREHAHVSADITDAVDLTTTGTVGQLVKTSSTGNVQSYTDPTEARDLARKHYVDREVGKKADIDELEKHDKAVVYLSFERTKTAWQWLVPSSPWWEPSRYTFQVPPGDYHVVVENAYYTATGLQFNGLPVAERVIKMPDTKWHTFDVSLPNGSGVQTQDSGGEIGERINVLMIPARMWEAFNVEFRRESEEQSAAQKSYVDQEVGKKADTGHKHLSADITDTVYRAGTSDTANKVIAASGTGRLYYDKSPGTTDEIVNRKYVDSSVSDKATKSEVGKKADTTYVDQELGKKSDAGHTHSIDQELEKYLPGELDERVPPKVAEVIGGDRVVYDAAAAAVGEAAEDIKWHHGTVSVDVTSLDDLPDGVHGVAAAVVARNLGLPGSLGTIQIQRIISGRTALYISQKTATQDLSVWVTSLNSGVWSEWERVSSENHYVGEIPDGASADDYRTPGQAWGVRSNRNITGLPVDTAGSLEVLSTGNRQIQRFTTWEFVPREFIRASTSTSWYGWNESGAGTADTTGDSTGEPGLKTVPLALTAGVGGDGATSGTFRTLVQVGAPITRWRLHIGNIHPRTGVSRGGFTLGSVSVGAHAGDGARDEAQSLSPSSVTVADGEEWVSPWVDGVDLMEEQVIEYDFSGATRTYLTLGTGWDASTSRTTAVDRLPLWLWIEAETYSHTPVVALIGDSTGAGHGSDQPVHGAALAIAGRKHGFLPVLYSHSGDTLEGNGDYDEDFSFQRWDHLDRPDSVIIQAGSNDIHSGNSLTELRRRFTNAAGAAHRLAPVVFGGTVKPRDPAHADYDDNRVAYNDWLGSQPEGIRGVVDFSAAVAPNGAIPNGHSADGAHLNATGHSAMATALDDITVARPELAARVERIDAATPTQGTGFPEGKVSAPVGSIYTDRLATNGAIRWIKTTGTGDTGWKVEYGDTGWRVLPHHSDNSGLTGQGRILIRRQGNLITAYFDSVGVTDGSGAALVIHTRQIPRGFAPENRIGTILTMSASLSSYDYADLRFNTSLWFLSRRRLGAYSTDRTGMALNGEVSWTTNDPWPTSLPGTPS